MKRKKRSIYTIQVIIGNKMQFSDFFKIFFLLQKKNYTNTGKKTQSRRIFYFIKIQKVSISSKWIIRSY